MKIADRYAGDPVLFHGESVTADGKTLRVRVVETDFKYPLLRVEDRVVRNPRTGAEELSTQTAMVADHVLVKSKAGVTRDDFEAMLKRVGGIVHRRIPNSDLYVVRFPNPGLDTVPDAVAALKAEEKFVQYAEPDYIVHAELLPDDDRFGDLWGMHNTEENVGTPDADIDAPEAWDLATGSLSVRVAVIDTGIDLTHPDLAANIWTNPGEIDGNGIDDDANGYIDDVHGWNFFNETNDPTDDHSHGSHCSGTIGGVGNDGVGVAGVCWQVSLVGLKFLSASGSGSTSDATEAVYYATSIGVKLTSNSWGGSGYSQALKDAIDDADAAGILFVAAAGNYNSNNDSIGFYPSGYSCANIISVAATDQYDNRASFSNYGATTVDLAAPGVSILSSVPGGGYAYFNGTSMATPHVAGACALLWSYRPSLTNSEIKDILLRTADQLPSMNDKVLTNGRLNIGNALLSELNVAPYQTLASSGFQDGVFAPLSHVITLTNGGTTPLAWTAANSQPWLDLSSTGDTLDPGASSTVTVTLNAATASLVAGDYEDTVAFTDTAAGVTFKRRVTLTVLEPLSVTPTAGFTSRGDVGGPFTPSVVGYELANESNSPLMWSAASSQSWLVPSPVSGTLNPGQSSQLIMRLTEACEALTQGFHFAQITVTNTSNGNANLQTATLTVAPDPLTEIFDTSANDLDYQAFTFTPTAASASYLATRKAAYGFQTSPSGGTTLNLGDDQSIAVTLNDGATVPFFGVSYDKFYVSSNGYITFGAGDADVSESLTDHFRLPRIAGHFDDLDPSAGGTISWRQLEDRVAVTYQSVPEWWVGGSNSFQIEIFFDGRIRITYLSLSSGDGLAGLSPGTGVPSPFYESNFSNYPPTPLLVTTLQDEDDGALGLGSGDSLREIIEAAALSAGPDVIQFDPSLDGGTVVLAGIQLTIDSDLTIETTGLTAGISVSGNQLTRVFEITAENLVTITGLTITEGCEHQDHGGAILNAGALILSHVTVDQSKSMDSFSNGSGGGIYSTGILRVDRCTVSQNYVFFGDGGGIWNSGTLDVVNSTVANNTVNVGFGGGIFSYGGSLKLCHATVSGNTVEYGSGGGISCPMGGLTLENSIVAGNFAGSVPDEIHGVSLAFSGSNLTSGDPMLAPLDDYGGSTETMPPLPGSPAIDAAVPLIEMTATDQMGDPRPNGPLPDLGATEAVPFSCLTLVDTDGDQIDDRLEPAYQLTVGVDDSGVDSDGDGSNDAEELANMTNPLDANSLLKVISFTPAPDFDPENPEFIVTFTSFPGLAYSVECTQTLDFSSPQVNTQSLGLAVDSVTSVQLGLAASCDFVRVSRDP